MVGLGSNREESIGSQHQDQFLNLERRRDRDVSTPRVLVRANLEAGVTSLMRRIPEACSWRLIVFAGGYATSDREGLP